MVWSKKSLLQQLLFSCLTGICACSLHYLTLIQETNASKLTLKHIQTNVHSYGIMQEYKLKCV